MNKCKIENCGGLLQNIDTTYHDPEGIRSDSICLKCGRYHGSSKAHTRPMSYPATCLDCGEYNVSIKYKDADPPVCIYCEHAGLSHGEILLYDELSAQAKELKLVIQKIRKTIINCENCEYSVLKVLSSLDKISAEPEINKLCVACGGQGKINSNWSWWLSTHKSILCPMCGDMKSR